MTSHHVAWRLLLLLLVVATGAWPVWPRLPQRVLWNQPFTPFRIVGNVYYVGVAGLSSFLIVTPEGSFLLDGAVRESAPLIARSIDQLGFRLTDVRFLLSSHVHYDHAGGLADLKRESGAQMIASQSGGYWLQIGTGDVPPVRVDRFIDDGDKVQLGGTTMTALITPGHSPGCTTWVTTTTENKRTYQVVFYCGTSVVSPLVGNAQYPHIVEDYERTFSILRELPADVFLEGHPERWDMTGKLRRLQQGDATAFVDPTELPRFVDNAEREFRAELRRQQMQK